MEKEEKVKEITNAYQIRFGVQPTKGKHTEISGIVFATNQEAAVYSAKEKVFKELVETELIVSFKIVSAIKLRTDFLITVK